MNKKKSSIKSYFKRSVENENQEDIPSKKSNKSSDETPEIDTGSKVEVAHQDKSCQPNQTFTFPKTFFGRQHRSC